MYPSIWVDAAMFADRIEARDEQSGMSPVAHKIPVRDVTVTILILTVLIVVTGYMFGWHPYWVGLIMVIGMPFGPIRRPWTMPAWSQNVAGFAGVATVVGAIALDWWTGGGIWEAVAALMCLWWSAQIGLGIVWYLALGDILGIFNTPTTRAARSKTPPVVNGEQ